VDDQHFLEAMLILLRGEILAYSSKKNKESKKQQASLEKTIKRLEDQIKSNVVNYIANIDELDILNQELEEIRKKQAQGSIVRSSVSWYELGEKSTAFFCGLENRNFINKTIQEIELEDGSICSEGKIILEHQKHFYENLYSSKDNGVNDEVFFQNISKEKIPRLTEEECGQKQGDIQYNELLTSLKKMKNNKSPGLDGYTAEFFKFVWIDLGHFLLRSINWAYKSGKLSITQRQGIITCIPKHGKSRKCLTNWRPISLLNTTYKLMSSCIAERIKSSLDKLIHNDQKGFIPGRCIADNSRLLYDIMFETEKQNIPGLIMMIDFEKAFDSVSWAFIQSVLGLFGFGESIKKWVRLFYESSESCIIQNGNFSPFLAWVEVVGKVIPFPHTFSCSVLKFWVLQ
jgi:hypothetical protein